MLEFGSSRELLSNVRPEVLERTVQLAYEIAAEGREGKPIGTLFVLGESEAVLEKSKQLVMNPFRGYPEETRNILDPTLSETIKEFACIDGAFIVRDDGVVLAAGAYLTPGTSEVELPAGYGTRHQAAAAISAVTNAYGIAVSESTGTVTVYKKGVTLTTLERGRRDAS
jgi:DNA integrity scanning protein DisA with diadenylate cyclase activity